MAAAACLVLSLPAFASPQGDSEEEVANEGRPVLDEITVTATRRDEVEAQDVGVSLLALDEETLEREGMDSFQELATGVPGLAFAERGPGMSLVVLRGVNSSTTQFNSDEPESKETVGIYFDETPVSLNGYHPDPRFFDLERIEVLRGPQGTLFGSGSLSGTIRYLSNAPDPSARDARVTTTYSATHEGGSNVDVNGMMNVPLAAGRSAFRLAVFGRLHDGFIDNVAPQTDPRHPLFGQAGSFSFADFEDVDTNDTWGGRAQLLFQGDDRWRLLFRLYRQDTRLGGYPTEDTYVESEPVPGNNPADAELGDYEQSRLLAERNRDELTLYSADLRVRLGGAELVSVTSYVKRALDQNYEFTDFLPFLSLVGALPIPISYTDPLAGILNNTTEVEDFIQEVRVVSEGSGRFQWLAGAFYQHQDKVFDQDAPTPGLDAVVGEPLGNNIFLSHQTFDDRQLAAFGEVSWDLDPRWRLVAGLRWFDFKQDMVFDSIGGLFSAGLDVESELREDGVNPKLSLEYRPGDDWLVYATAAKGFRLGGTNDPSPPICGLGVSAESFESDSLWNYEVGVKGSLRKRVRLSGAVFAIDWTNVPVADARACGFAVTRNAGKVESEGVEADLAVAVTRRFELTAGFSYTDARFARPFASEDGSFLIADGTETPLVPEWTFAARAAYYFPIKAGSFEAAGYFNASWSYQGERFNNANTLVRFAMGSYELLNVRLGLDAGKWGVSVFADNLLDEKALLFKDTIFLVHNRDTVNRPRTVGVTFSVDL